MAKCIEGVARLRPSKSFRSVFRHTRNNFARSSREVPRRSFLSIFARGGSKRSPPPSSSRGSFLTGFHMRVDGNILIAPHAGRANFHQGIRNYARRRHEKHKPPFYALSLLRDFERDSNNSKEAFRNRVSQRTGGRCWIDRTWELCATKKNWLITQLLLIKISGGLIGKALTRVFLPQ